jgi:hypothetical protein
MFLFGHCSIQVVSLINAIVNIHLKKSRNIGTTSENTGFLKHRCSLMMIGTIARSWLVLTTSFNELSPYEHNYISTHEVELIRNLVLVLMYVAVTLYCSLTN